MALTIKLVPPHDLLHEFADLLKEQRVRDLLNVTDPGGRNLRGIVQACVRYLEVFADTDILTRMGRKAAEGAAAIAGGPQ